MACRAVSDAVSALSVSASCWMRRGTSSSQVRGGEHGGTLPPPLSAESSSDTVSLFPSQLLRSKLNLGFGGFTPRAFILKSVDCPCLPCGAFLAMVTCVCTCFHIRLWPVQRGHRPREEGIFVLWHCGVHGPRGGEPSGSHPQRRLVVIWGTDGRFGCMESRALGEHGLSLLWLTPSHCSPSLCMPSVRDAHWIATLSRQRPKGNHEPHPQVSPPMSP